MKCTRICPKCRSDEFVKAMRGHGTLFLSLFRAVSVSVEICTGCGFVEEFVTAEHINKLKRHGSPICNQTS